MCTHIIHICMHIHPTPDLWTALKRATISRRKELGVYNKEKSTASALNRWGGSIASRVRLYLASVMVSSEVDALLDFLERTYLVSWIAVRNHSLTHSHLLLLTD